MSETNTTLESLLVVEFKKKPQHTHWLKRELVNRYGCKPEEFKRYRGQKNALIVPGEVTEELVNKIISQPRYNRDGQTYFAKN